MADALHLRGFNDYGFVLPGSITNHTLDANNDGLAWALQPHDNTEITHLGFRYGARTGTPPTYSIRLEGLDASGDPDNADVGGGSATAKTFTPPADATWDGTWQWIQLTNAYTPTQGQMLCATIRYSSGTIDGSNNSSITRNATTHSAGNRGFPFTSTLTSGTWAPQSNGYIFAYRTASGRYGTLFQSNYQTATANTAGHRSAMHFTLASGWGSTFKPNGIVFIGKLSALGGSCKVGIWDSSWVEQASVTIDGDHTGQSPGMDNAINPIYFTSSPTLNYGTKYYCGLEVISGTVGIGGIVLAEAADRSSFPNGTNRGLVTWNGTTTTETDTVMPLCDLVFDEIAVPAGGGGSFIIGG